MSRESVDRNEIVRKILAGPAPANEAIAMIGAMVAIIEKEQGVPASRQLLAELSKH